MRVLLFLLLVSSAAAQHDAGLVWDGMARGLIVSGFVHNAAQSMPVGNTRGNLLVSGGIVSNPNASASWVGVGTNQDLAAGASGLTIAVWVRQVFAAGMSLAANIPSTSATGTVSAVSFNSTPSTRRGFYLQASPTNYWGLDSSTFPALHNSNWQHLVFTWLGGTNLVYYQNGVQYPRAVTTVGGGATNWPGSGGTLRPSTTEFRFGAYHNAAFSFLQRGNSMQLAKVWQRGMPSNEVAALYMLEGGEVFR